MQMHATCTFGKYTVVYSLTPTVLSLKGTGEGERGVQGKKKRPSFLVPVLTDGYSLLMDWRGTGASCDIVKATTVYIHVLCNSPSLLILQFSCYGDNYAICSVPPHSIAIT